MKIDFRPEPEFYHVFIIYIGNTCYCSHYVPTHTNTVVPKGNTINP